MVSLRSLIPALVLTAVVVTAAPRPTLGQTPPKKDDALERLLEKIDEPKPPSPAPTDPAKKADAKPAPAGEPSKKDEALEKLFEKLDNPKPADPGKSDEKKPSKPGEVESKDQSLEKLLEGMGGADDKPAADDKKKQGGPGSGDEPPPPPAGGDKAKSDPLDNASKKLDDLLEEKTGRKPKKTKKEGQQGGQGQGQGGEGDDEEEGGGPLGDLVKQMREVENRLGKPDTGAETRKKQIEIVKNLDGLLEQIRNSSSQGQAMKMIRGGPKPGGPPKPGQGNQPGATGDGVGMSKPTPPRTPPAPKELAKEVWGQLPKQLRDDTENVLNENPLPNKAEMIRLYYLSLGKKSASKED